MAADPTSAAEIDAIFERLRAEVRASQPSTHLGDRLAAMELPSRRELDRLWAVSGDRPYFARPGRWGRLRGFLLIPIKLFTRKLVRWYVEPIATDQRAFNAAVIRTIDELTLWTRSELERLEREQSAGRPAADEQPGP